MQVTGSIDASSTISIKQIEVPSGTAVSSSFPQKTAISGSHTSGFEYSGTISGSATSTGSFGSVHTAGNVGIGTASPDGVLDLSWGGGDNVTSTLLLGADTGARTRSDNTAKTATIAVPKFDNEENPLTFAYLVGADGTNSIRIGGGTTPSVAATDIKLSLIHI